MLFLSPRSIHSLLVAPVLLALSLFAGVNSDNQPPVANPDFYTVHGSFSSPLDYPPYGVLRNDTDPDGDPLSCVFSIVNTSLGTAIIYWNGRVDFTAASGQTGTVNVPYTVCDNHGACTGGTVTFDVVNHGPIAVDDIYVVRDPVFSSPPNSPPFGPLKNDSDLDGDSIQADFNRVDLAQGTGFVYGSNSLYPYGR